jgi:hypothetical protein
MDTERSLAFLNDLQCVPMTDFFADRRPHNGLSYEDYRARWREEKDESPDGKDPEERRRLHFLDYNWDRQAHVHEEYTPSDDLRDAVEGIDEPQLWMVLTEPWCGDSAFLLPVIAEAAQSNDAVTLRILLRDDNLDVMDQYLTDGSRSIPKLVAFSDDGEELFTWGPRPEGARQRFAELKEAYDDKMEMVRELVAYYEEGHWREADQELAAALQASTPTPAE